MAEGVLRDPDPFSCSVCLDTLKDPVTIPCGHSYCMGCITGFWDHNADPRDVHSCPQCRQTFTPRPALNKNTLLVELVEKLNKTTSQTSPPLHYAAPGDVECDICPGRKLRAAKSCLQCLASYCQTHLQPHLNSPAFKKHKLVNASLKLQEKLCPRHDKLLEVYCHTDEQCICLLCVMDEHKGHDIVSAAAERSEKQRKMGEIHMKFQQKIKDGEETVQKLKHSVQSLVLSAQATVDESETVCKELIRSIERMRCEVEVLIRRQEKTAVDRTEEQLKQLERDVSELKAKDTELTELSQTEDNIHFLQNFQSFYNLPRSESLQNITIYPDFSFDQVKKLVSKLKSQVNNIFRETTAEISEKVKKVQIVRVLKPKTTEERMEYHCQLTADPDTACQTLDVSENDRKVEWSDGKQVEPRPERFIHFDQVLCREALSGTCYWEVECKGFVGVAVSYGIIARRGEGEECKFGGTDQSWSLECSPSTGFFLHDNVRTTIKRYSRPSRVGVYLEHEAGTMSFYSIGKKVTCLHKVQTTFSQPLFAGFRVGLDSYVRICDV